MKTNWLHKRHLPLVIAFIFGLFLTGETAAPTLAAQAVGWDAVSNAAPAGGRSADYSELAESCGLRRQIR